MRDLAKVFAILKEHKKIGNSVTKCAFGVSLEKFLGHLVTQCGIKANPKKIMAINDLVNPTTANEVKKLTDIWRQH